MKKKYYKTYKYINNELYDNKGKLIIKKELYDILKKYKVPSHLHDVVLVANTIEEADNGIIYIGLDSKNKKQYIYGTNFIRKRREQRINIFLNIEKKLPSIEKYIKNELKIFENNNIGKNITGKNITTDTLFAIILLMEINFFIRTGKKKYLKDNETIGLLTLQKSNFKICNNSILISFKGKLSQKQEFNIDKVGHNLLYKIITILYNNTDDFIFKDNEGNVFTESKMYYMMKKFNLKLKDIRTFGVNRILIMELWKEIQNLNDTYILDLRKRHVKKIMSDIIIRTANIIGHTPSISKKSYIVDELRTLINTDIIKNSKQMTFKKFYKYIICKLKEI